jgi:hypothetical protein
MWAILGLILNLEAGYPDRCYGILQYLQAKCWYSTLKQVIHNHPSDTMQMGKHYQTNKKKQSQ